MVHICRSAARVSLVPGAHSGQDVRVRNVLVVVALTCAACANAGDGDDHVSPPSTVPAPLSARIELDSTTVAAGEGVSGRVIVVNDSGNTVRAQGCGGLFQVALSNEDYEPMLSWQDCLEDFLLPMGESSYPVVVRASVLGCSATSRPGIDCDANNSNPPLEPGEYEATLHQRARLVPDPEPVDVQVTD